MTWIIAIILIVIVLIFIGKINASSNISQTLNLDVPNPETANPKKVIQFISIYDKDEISQVYKQLKEKNIKIPKSLDEVFKEKINKGYIFREDFFWKVSIEDFQREKESLYSFKNTYSFELKGLHVNSYRSKLKDCIVYDSVEVQKDIYNKYDKNAIKVVSNSGLIGHVPADETSTVLGIIQQNHKAFIKSISKIEEYIDVSIIIHY